MVVPGGRDVRRPGSIRNRIFILLFLLLLIPAVGAAQARSDAPQAETRNPHGALTVPCDSCHTFTSWKPIRSRPDFDHAKTSYPLRGAHANAKCTQCHVSLEFKNAGARCANCHADLHRGQFGARCDQCHSVKGWTMVKSLQQHQNRFPLLGAHATVDCDVCHKNGPTGQFTGMPTDCMYCHSKDYQSAQDPDHQTLAFPSTCQDCHTVNSWIGAKFDHLRFAHYALTGAHASLPCSACHPSGQYKGTQVACFACHQTDYNGTANPNHTQAGFPTDCSLCHSTSTWAGAIFDHSQTGFPLTGAHTSVACATCHVNGVYKGLSTACVSCHLSNYNSTTNPNHVQYGYPTNCEICHNTTAWQPASFDHSKTAFPLTGAHTTVPCTSCHINGVYAGTPTDCYSCHKADYQGTTDPNHAAAGFPTTCQTCHTTTSWLGATFNHTWFPIYSGTHQGKWTTCADCHINSSNYAVFSCITCHTHDKSIVDPAHSGVSGYTYSATSCYTCHPTGLAGN